MSDTTAMSLEDVSLVNIAERATLEGSIVIKECGGIGTQIEIGGIADCC